jgi:hypothetical protein
MLVVKSVIADQAHQPHELCLSSVCEKREMQHE